MNVASQLRLDRLSLQNFRCFEHCAIDFHEKLTVLIAENGQGKTAVLDAIAITLGLFVETVTGKQQFRGFDRTDVRLTRSQNGTMTPHLPTAFAAEGQVAGQPVKWSRELTKYTVRARASTKQAQTLRQAAQGFLDESATARSILPLIAFYGTGRLWSEHRLSEKRKERVQSGPGRFWGYTDCLTSFSSFKGFVTWYGQKMDEIRDPAFKGELSESLPLISGVNDAVRTVLEPVGWRELEWDSTQKTLKVNHAVHGQLPLSLLSDGVRNMIALIADIAYRCAILNPHLREQASLQTQGILLIDEVDMHLHPRWQQLVVDLLSRAFPSLQIILSTHSPHVLSTVNNQSIRVVDLLDGAGQIESPRLQTQGVESASVLATVMDVDPIPQIGPAVWLSEYKALIQTGEHYSKTGKDLFAKLLAHFGEGHPVLAEIETLRRLQEFRHSNKIPPQEGH